MKYRYRVFSLIIVFTVLATLPGAANGAGYTALVSLESSGAQSGNDASQYPSVSADGRYVAFASTADDLLAGGDGNGDQDVFVYDRKLHTTRRVSVGPGGIESDGGNSSAPAISGNGRYVAFHSDANNLVAGDSLGNQDVFVYDYKTGVTVRVSVGLGGVEADDDSWSPSISNDGRYVAFYSAAANLVAGDTNGLWDVFVYDRKTRRTERASVGPGGAQAEGGDSNNTAISGNGRYVAFQSLANNLLGPGVDTNGNLDVFVYDRKKHTTLRASVGTGGAQVSGDSTIPSISSDGRYVAFQSLSDTLVAGDTNTVSDVFVHDFRTHVTERVSVASDGAETAGASNFASISGDGRFVAFRSGDGTLVDGDSNTTFDIFVHDRKTGVTGRASVAEDGSQANGASGEVAISADGGFVTFECAAEDLVPNDANTATDVFAVSNPVLFPTLVSPANYSALPAGRDKVKLAWRPPAGVKKNLIGKYEVQLATDINFTQVVKTALTKKTSLQIKGLLPNTHYFWRVRILLRDGSPCTWASLAGDQTFDTIMTRPPALVKPKNNSLETKANITLAWKHPKGAPKTTIYTLQYDDDPNFGSPVTVANIAGAKYVITGAPINTPPVTVYWHVKAFSADGLTEYSDWSASRIVRR